MKKGKNNLYVIKNQECHYLKRFDVRPSAVIFSAGNSLGVEWFTDPDGLCFFGLSLMLCFDSEEQASLVLSLIESLSGMPHNCEIIEVDPDALLSDEVKLEVNRDA